MDAKELKELESLLADAATCARLTKWEETFIERVAGKVNEYGEGVRISEKEQEILDKIERKVYAT